MKKYIVDTNVFLRFFLKDSPTQFQKSKELFEEAASGNVELETLSEILFEIDYVLKGVYKLTKHEICNILTTIIKSPDISIAHNGILLDSVEKYRKSNLDLVDIYLYYYAKDCSSEVFSFDKDFSKLQG